jgi:hypothetical protein
MPSSPPSSLTFVPTPTIRSGARRAENLLSEDPETLRATWDLTGVIAAGQPAPLPVGSLVYPLVLVVVVLAVGGFVFTKVGHLL